MNSFADGYTDAQAVDDLIAAASTTLDEEERLQILSEIQRCSTRRRRGSCRQRGLAVGSLATG